MWPSEPGRILGPAELAYLDRPDFAPRSGEPVDAVALAEITDAVAALEHDAGPDDVNEVGITDRDVAAVRDLAGHDGRCCLCVPGHGFDRLAHMMVLTHPDHRGRGLAQRAATEAARHALEAGLIPQWAGARAGVAGGLRGRSVITMVGAQLSLRLV